MREREGHTHAHSYRHTRTQGRAQSKEHINLSVFSEGRRGQGTCNHHHPVLSPVPPPARPPHPKIALGTVLILAPTLSYLIPPLPFRSLFRFCCFTLDLLTIFALGPPLLMLADAATTAVFARAPLPLVLADAATTAVFARAPPSLVFAEAATTAVFARTPPALVLAEAATAAVFARAPLTLVLADAATATVFAPAPLSLVLADAAATTVFTCTSHSLVLAYATAATVFAPAPLPLVLADAAATTVFTRTPHPLVVAEAAAAAVFAPAPLPVVRAEGRGLAGLLGCRRMWRRSCGRARCIGWFRITLCVLAALSLWPCSVRCVPLQHSLLARRGSLRAIRVIRYPLRHILHVEPFCAVGTVLPPGDPVYGVLFRATRPLRSCKRRQY